MAKSLRGRLILIVSTVSVICMACMASVNYQMTASRVGELAVENYETSTANTTNQLMMWLTDQEKLVKDWSSVLEISKAYDPSTIKAWLKGVVNDYNEDGFIYDLYYVSSSNVMTAGSGYVQEPGIDFTKRSWYEEAIKADGVAYSTPYLDADSGKIVITLSEKVTNGSTVEGVLAADIFVDTLISIVNEQEMPEDSYCFLVDDKGNVVNHPDKSFAYVEDEPIGLADSTYANYKRLAKAVNEKKSTCTFKDYDGSERTFYINTMKSCNWKVIAAVSNRVIGAQASSIRIVSGIILIVSIAVMVLVVMGIAKAIVRPIRSLTQQIKSGSTEEKIHSATTIELQELETEFNRLMGNLRGLLTICDDAKDNLGSFGDSISQITKEVTTGARNVDTQMVKIVDTLNNQSEDMQDKQNNLLSFGDSIATFRMQFDNMEEKMASMLDHLGESVQSANRLEKSAAVSNQHLRDIYTDISSLKDMSTHITEIVSTIMNISSQTNLLALNASIEAARAGEAGKGFAVVAEEIRVLSTNTAEATESISKQITGIQSLIGKMAELIGTSANDFEENTKESSAVQNLLTKINASVVETEQVNKNLKESLVDFVKNKEVIDSMFEAIEENIHICLEASVDAQKNVKAQTRTVGTLMEESTHLAEMASEFKRSTGNFNQ